MQRTMGAAVTGCLQYNLLKSIGTGATVGATRALTVAKAGDRVDARTASRSPSSRRAASSRSTSFSDYLFVSAGRTQFFVNLVAPSSAGSELPALENRIAKLLASRARPCDGRLYPPTAAGYHCPAGAFGRRFREMRTTLKRGVGRGAGLNGENGHAVLPPTAVSSVSRYRVPPEKPRTGLGLLGRILLVTLLTVVGVGLAVAGGAVLWYHESLSDIRPHSVDVKVAQKELNVTQARARGDRARDRLRPARRRRVLEHLALRHGDARPRRSGDEHDLAALDPARPRRADLLPEVGGDAAAASTASTRRTRTAARPGRSTRSSTSRTSRSTTSSRSTSTASRSSWTRSAGSGSTSTVATTTSTTARPPRTTRTSTSSRATSC